MKSIFDKMESKKEKSESTDGYKFFAFISYNKEDVSWGFRLLNRLEDYRIPASIRREKKLNCKKIKPVFFSPTEMQIGELNERIKSGLRASRHLIVICSPNSAKSEWVGKEIEYFNSLGRKDNIHLFMVDGQHPASNPENESFNPVIGKIFFNKLAADIHEANYFWKPTKIPNAYLNKKRAYVQLISALLGVEFARLWKRELRRMVKRIISWSLLTIAVLVSLFAVWKMNSPVDVRVKLREASAVNRNLPPMQNAVVRLYLDKEVKTDTLSSKDASLTFSHIPHSFLDKMVRLRVECEDFLQLDTMVVLSEDMLVGIGRDPRVYGYSKFYVRDDKTNEPLAGVSITFGDTRTVSDKDGMVEVSVNSDKQRLYYPIICNGVRLSDSICLKNFGKDSTLQTKPIFYLQL